MWVLAVLGAVVLIGFLVHTAVRVRRLDRLHARTDAARAGLGSALERRARAALAVAGAREVAGAPESAGSGRPGADPLRAAAAAVLARGGDREVAENALGRALATVDRSVLPPAVRDELAEAEQLLVLARHVHNDAVRDTLGLRSRRLVRWLHLAGTAPLPRYFEIADPEQAATGEALTAARRPAAAPPR